MVKKTNTEIPQEKNVGKKKFHFSFKKKRKPESQLSKSDITPEEKIKALLSKSKFSSKEMQFLKDAQEMYPQYKEELKQARENTLVGALKDKKVNKPSPKKEAITTSKTKKDDIPKKSLLEKLREYTNPEKKAARKQEKNRKVETSVAVTGKKPKGIVKKKVDNIKENIRSVLRKKGTSSISEESNISPSEARNRAKAYLNKKNKIKPGRSR
ncbi:hypothetical protein NOVO_07230 [Rickettsiales bacterium Ac37b]|nr:hypothetical protein NOVO_07230 [Rickettsiales bacterium Ac37b]